MFCTRCSGTGKYLGNGMMIADCDLCDDGEIIERDISPATKVDRKSKSYKTAIKEIMALNPEISRSEATEMFDKAYDKA